MNWLSEWFNKAKKILLGPKEFFREARTHQGLGYPMKFAVTSAIFGGILASILGVIFPESIAAIGGQMLPTSYMLVVSMVVLGLIGGTIGLLLNAGIVHIFVHLLGGKGYQKTVEATAYSYAITLISWIPVINFFVGIYGLYIQARGIEKFHEMSFGRALGALILSAVVTGLLIVGPILILWFWMGGISTNPPSAAPQPV